MVTTPTLHDTPNRQALFRRMRGFGIAYAVASVMVLILGRQVLISANFYVLVFLAYLFGPLGFLAHFAIDPGSALRPALILYVPATVLLLVCAALSRHANRVVRIAAWCVGAAIWIGAGYAGSLLLMYGH